MILMLGNMEPNLAQLYIHIVYFDNQIYGGVSSLFLVEVCHVLLYLNEYSVYFIDT